ILRPVHRLVGPALAGALVPSSFVGPSAAVAVGPASSMFFTDGPTGYAPNGHVLAPAVTFQASGSAPYAEVTFSPEDTPMVTGFSGPDDTQIAAGTYLDATFPQTAGKPYFRTYDAHACRSPPNPPAGHLDLPPVTSARAWRP